MELEPEAVPTSLRAGIWDILLVTYFRNPCSDFSMYEYSEEFDHITWSIWFHFFKRPTDERPGRPHNALQELKIWLFDAFFFDFYNFIEFLGHPDLLPYSGKAPYFDAVNSLLAREKAVFRFAEGILIRITDPEELRSVEESMSSEPASVASHIRRAAELYSQRPEPDYRNSIKESISAVEAAVRFVVGMKTTGVSSPLGKAIDIEVHPALRQGFEKLYAYSSDESGVRHALMDESRLSMEDAKYMLVSCSAFANYLVAKKLQSNA